MNSQPPGYNPGESLLEGGNTPIQPVMGGGGGDPTESLLSGGNSVNITPLQGGYKEDKLYVNKKPKQKKNKTKSKRKTQKGGDDGSANPTQTIHELNDVVTKSTNYLSQLQSSLLSLQQAPQTEEIVSTTGFVKTAISQLDETINQATIHIANLTATGASPVDAGTSSSAGVAADAGTSTTSGGGSVSVPAIGSGGGKKRHQKKKI